MSEPNTSSNMKSILKSKVKVLYDTCLLRKDFVYSSITLIGNTAHVRDYVIHQKEVYDNENLVMVPYPEEEQLRVRTKILEDTVIDNLFESIEPELPSNLGRVQKDRLAHQLAHLVFVQNDFITDEDDNPTQLTIWGLQPDQWEIYNGDNAQ